MNIELFTFNKRENSTKRPAGPGAVYNCVLKKDTSVVSPEILIDFSDQDAPQTHLYNYAYIPDLGRYYFIADQRCVHGMLWVYSLTCDIMATYKTDITASTLYLTRCSTQYDGDIVDTYYPVQTSFTAGGTAVASPWANPLSGFISISTGCFILGVVAKSTGSSANTYGSIQYYALPQAALYDLCDALLDDSILSNFSVQDASLALQKAIVDPLSFIKSCIWCPISYTSITQAEDQTLKVWDWTLQNVRNKRIVDDPPYRILTGYQIQIPKHPQAASRGNYLNVAPYTEYSLDLPPFGYVQLDTTKLANNTHINFRYIYDLITGVCTVIVFANDGGQHNVNDPVLTRLKTQVGVPIQLSQVTKDYLNGVTNTVGGIAGFVTNALAGNWGGAIQSGISAIGSAANASRPMPSSVGSSGGFSDLHGGCVLHHIFYDPAPEDLDHVGRPLCQNVAMASVAAGSYCLAMDGDVSIAGTAGEQQSLKAYLEGGFYYE